MVSTIIVCFNMVYFNSVSEEIHTLRANLKEARMEHQSMEAQLRELRSTETATKVGPLRMLKLFLTGFLVQSRIS